MTTNCEHNAQYTSSLALFQFNNVKKVAEKLNFFFNDVFHGQNRIWRYSAFEYFAEIKCENSLSQSDMSAQRIMVLFQMFRKINVSVKISNLWRICQMMRWCRRRVGISNGRKSQWYRIYSVSFQITCQIFSCWSQEQQAQVQVLYSHLNRRRGWLQQNQLSWLLFKSTIDSASVLIEDYDHLEVKPLQGRWCAAYRAS